MKHIPQISHLNSGNFTLIAGPCAIEGHQMAHDIAGEIRELANELEIPFIFKGSYRKANRSRLDSFTGIGDQAGLDVLESVQKQLAVPVTTDVHSAQEATWAGKVVDVLQIPAFLCRQTDLLVAAAETGKVVNVKKGQFLSAESMQFAVQKIKDSGNDRAWLTERGNTFGYTDLVVDFRGLPIMREYAPVILDVTHSLQRPNQGSGVTGGTPSLISTIARAGVAVGVDGIFIETHPDPSKAKSDGANMLPLSELRGLLEGLLKLHNA